MLRSGLKKAKHIFNPFGRNALLLLLILLATTFFDILSIGMILPLLQILIRPQEAVPVASWAMQMFPKKYHLLVVCSTMLVIVGCKSSFTLLKQYYSSYFINNLRSYWAIGIKSSYLFSRYRDIIRHKQGVLLNNMLQETSFASKALRDSVDLTANALIAIGISTLMLIVNWQITLVIGVIAIASQAVLWRFARDYATGVGQKKIRLNQQITQTAAESIAGIRQIKIFSLEKSVLNEFARNLKKLVTLMVRFQVISTLPMVFGEMLMVFVIISLILFYRYWLNSEVITLIPVLSLFTVSILRLFSVVSKLLNERMSVASYWPSLLLVRDLCDKKDGTENSDGGIKFNGLTNSITFDHVDFEFEKDSRLFENLCLEIPKSRITAVVGLSGAGKSTLCDLITKFYRPTKGKICIDGNNLGNISIQSWRRRIGYVSQDTFLFNATIAENIALGVPEGAAYEHVIWAAKMAGVNEFIETLSQGYQTPVGHGGVTLSGGQRQRIAIARALIRDPDLLIFDEATSSLDSKIERQLLEAIKNIASNKAVLFITHRLASLWIADFIYYLEDGRIVESGSYHSLIEARGSLWKLLQISEGEYGQNKTFHSN